MNNPLRRVAVALFILFALLFLNLNWVQYVKGDDLRTDPKNRRVLLHEYSRQRGAIVVDGTAVANSVETGGRLQYQRQYSAGQLYAHVTGYKSVTFGETGIEQTEDSVLSGEDDRLFVRRLSDMITGRKARGGNAVLTLNRDVQQASLEALEGHTGAVVSMDPRTGEILSLVSAPTYDPEPLASHEATTEREAWERYNSDPNKPMLNRALNQTYPPGSTFKVILSALALSEGSSPSSQIDSPVTYTPPQTTRQIQNFGGSSCGSDQITLERALTVSCNTSFAILGNQFGAEKIRQQAQDFGFEDRTLRSPLAVSESRLGAMADPPAEAQSAIGQRDVRMTPLQGAMVAAAVANNGRLMKPYLVSEIQAPDLSVLDKTRPRTYSEPLTERQARDLQQMMNSVVSTGTGQNARVSGVTVGGKTGTAEDGDERQDHEWFIGYAMVDGAPVAAVAVVLENAGTSSADSARIASVVIESIVNGSR